MTRARILWTRRLVGDGAHNAVTSLARWGGQTWLAHRKARDHFHEPPGALHVLASTDLERWDEAARVAAGLDDRDPKLVADGKRLWLFFGATRLAPRPGRKRWTESMAAWTEDGRTWTAPRRIHAPGWWLWSPARFEDGWWCAAYGCGGDEEPPEQRVELLRSSDGLDWRHERVLIADGRANETCLLRRPDGAMLAIARGRGVETLVLEAAPPYAGWRERSVPHWMQAPCALELGARVVGAGRDRGGAGGTVTRLWELGEGGTQVLLDLPSGGDTSYCGLVAEGERAFLVSWYSQHEFLDRPGFVLAEGPSAVYLARVELSA
jgi:hypothetical protein